MEQAPHYHNSLYHSNRASTRVPSPTGRGREGAVRLLVSRYFPQSRFVEQAPHYHNSLYHSNRASTRVPSPTGRGREGDSTTFGKQIFSAKQVCGTSSTLLQFSLSLQSSFNACFLSTGRVREGAVRHITGKQFLFTYSISYFYHVYSFFKHIYPPSP